MQSNSNFWGGFGPDSKPRPRVKNYIYSCEKRQGWKWSQIVHRSHLNTKCTATVILVGGFAPDSKPCPLGKNYIYT